jgi:membrane fusion protein
MLDLFDVIIHCPTRNSLEVGLSHTRRQLAKFLQIAGNGCSLLYLSRACMIVMTAKQDLFRNSAIEALGHRWFSTVQIISPPTALPVAIIALAALGCLALAALVIEVPERVPASGVLLPRAGLLKVRVRQSGWVDEIAVSDGAVVAQGQALLRLVDTERAPERQPESLARLASLHNELTLLETSIDQELAMIAARSEHQQRRRHLLQRRLKVAEQEHETYRQESALQGEFAARLNALATRGLLAQQRVQEATTVTLQSQAASASAWQRVMGLQEALMLLEQQFANDAGATALLQTRGKMRRGEIMREIAALEQRSATEITAPGGGIVAGLTVRRGSYVQSGQVILTLHDPADLLEARLFVSARNAALITTGQRVELQLSAYPHQLFGTQSAVITAISAAALPAREVNAPSAVQGAVFEIRARLDSARIEARGRVWPLPPGTAFKAQIVRRRWPLYRWLFRAPGATDSDLA